MSGHADTIRTDLQLAAEQIDALLAENQRYEKALKRAEDDFSQAERLGGSLGPWLRDSRGRVRKALAGDTE